MVKYHEERLNAVFSAVSDPTRRAMLARLAKGECTVTGLAEPFSMSLPAISKHLRVLESAGLISRQVSGRIHRCRLAAIPMKDALDWMSFYRSFWEERMDALGDYLTNLEPEEEHDDGESEDG
jgi:DNA-binding transcriptional ArsR family regulator